MPPVPSSAPATAGTRASDPRNGTVAVLVCSDNLCGAAPVSLDTMSTDLRQQASGVRVGVVQDVCAHPRTIGAAIEALGARRLVICCRHALEARDGILAAVSDAGLHPDAVAVVDTAPQESAPAADINCQALAQARSAVARVSSADLDAPIRFRSALRDVHLERRSLFRLGHWAPRPIACWRQDRCDGGATCRACAEACPHGALVLTSSGLSVDGAACTGCGACVVACRGGAISLNGASMRDLEAGATTLAEDARNLEVGVAISCSRATNRQLAGGRWLTFAVPSLEMVTAGWPLQFLAAGVRVKLEGCEEDACRRRADDLLRCCASLVGEVVTGSGPALAADGSVAVGTSRPSTGAIRFREPEATLEALASLTPRTERATSAGLDAPDGLPRVAGGRRWSVESSVLAAGEVVIDSARCTACGCCALSCPTGALSLAEGAERSYILDFDASACFACGACVSSCPEVAVSLRRVIDSTSFATGRRQLAEVSRGAPCRLCGRPLTADLPGSVIAQRLAGSHPAIADRLRLSDLCTDCLLVSPPGGAASVSVVGTPTSQLGDRGHD